VGSGRTPGSSASFEIPRSVQRDLDHESTDPAEQQQRLAAKNRHNAVTIALYLLVRWLHLFGLVLILSVVTHFHGTWDAVAVGVANVVVVLFTVAYFVLVERATSRLQTLTPLGCSIYDRAFWRHERYWKLPGRAFIPFFNGTPFKNVLWRLLGVRIGRRVFDDGCAFVEKTFVTIGDECTLNAGSIVQCHSQEDGAFKSDRTVVGAGATLGVGAFVHYGVTIGAGAALAPDSFLMKGEEIAPRGRWGGNPATEHFDTVDDLRDVLAVDRSPADDPENVPPMGAPTRKRPAAVAATALSALIVLTLSGGTAVAMGVPVPFGPAPRASAVPATPRPAPTPPRSSAPASAVAPTTTPEATVPTAKTTERTRSRPTTTAAPRRTKTTTPQATRTSPPKTTTTTTTRRAAGTSTRATPTTSEPTTRPSTTTSSADDRDNRDDRADD
jgi:hypothetical protein